MSGPLMDRIDLFIEVPAVKYEKLTSESSENLHCHNTGYCRQPREKRPALKGRWKFSLRYIFKIQRVLKFN